MHDNQEFYKMKGMSDCVGKPFTSQELWQCLVKYFKPKGWHKEDASNREMADNELRQKLINNFVKNNRTKFDEITEAINTGDIKLAHRLAHTLKSNAGQLHKTALQQASAEIEKQLADGENLVTPRQLGTLESELDAVLAELTPLVTEPDGPAAGAVPLETEAVFNLLDKLEPLLENFNTGCLALVADIRLIPGSGELIRHMEDLDFVPALSALAELKEQISRPDIR
jgi:HPt (histidine-containing phosphotransfer) domain-containing protein